MREREPINQTPLGDELRRVVVIDTETSGLDPYQHSLLSIGLVPLYTEERLELFVSEPSILADPRSMAIHGIDLEWLSTVGESPKVICERFETFLAHHSHSPVILAGHNITFDLRFMKRLYRLADRPWPTLISHRSLDTHSMLWQLAASGQIPFDACSSDGAFRYFNCAPLPQERHSALGDALSTRELLRLILARSTNSP